MKKSNQLTMPEVEWKEQIIPDIQKPPCNHYFEFVDNSSRAECKNCKMGLVGVYEIDNGKPIV